MQQKLLEDDDVEYASYRQRNNTTALLMLLLTTSCLLLFWTACRGQKEVLLRTEAMRDDNIYNCDLQLVESIPIGLNYSAKSPKFLSTFDAWKLLLDKANKSLDLGSFYWSLRGEDVNCNDSSAALGEEIFSRLLQNANNQDNINIRIAQSEPSDISPNLDTKLLANYGAAKVVSINFPKYFGGGVLHTKLWIVDNQHFYLGSANMDWRSLTQVKELGVLAQNCPQLASDVAKIFKAYWYLGSDTNAPIPHKWPYEYSTNYNDQQPMHLNLNMAYAMNGYISNSPPPLTADGRTHDLDAIIKTIENAMDFVYIAVMDYFPLIIYGPKQRFWPYIDNALREAAVERGVAIKMLISWWKHSDPSEDNFLRSLQDLSMERKHVDIQVRRFIVPMDPDQARIPFGRVNHNKYMVTDRIAYIGTSNWSGDYFTDTAGIALVLKDTLASAKNSLRQELQNIFERDWNSPYAHKFS
ncbi:phospholipase D3 [Scaptodrosophila lebanonensis]|uniref:Phospholipase D3 n=1 Tax=Drosophila lebanonensis TaxID=7225 RepID=A0A6J2U0K0_DROLE|nr:phospholipase D3 [Scaptodrosophila lebanonensis]